jgi:hypothetical protein
LIVDSVVAATVAIAAAIMGDIDVMAIVISLGEVAEALAYGECAPPTVRQYLTQTTF